MTTTPPLKIQRTDEGPPSHNIRLPGLGLLPDELKAEVLSYIPFYDIPNTKIPTSITIYGDGAPAKITYFNPKKRALIFQKRIWERLILESQHNNILKPIVLAVKASFFPPGFKNPNDGQIFQQANELVIKMFNNLTGVPQGEKLSFERLLTDCSEGPHTAVDKLTAVSRPLLLRKKDQDFLNLSSKILQNLKRIHPHMRAYRPEDAEQWLNDPRIAPTLAQLTSLNLLQLNITYLPEDAEFWSKFPNLNYLNFNDNQITILPDAMFQSCPRLETISIERNRLTEIPPFLHETNVTKFYVSKDSISPRAKETLESLITSHPAIQFTSYYEGRRLRRISHLTPPPLRRHHGAVETKCNDPFVTPPGTPDDPFSTPVPSDDES